MKEKAKFSLEVLSLRGLVFKGDVESVYLFGTEGEFELLPYHYPLMASLMESEVRIAYHDPLQIRMGIVMFRDNQCTIVAEMAAGFSNLKEVWF